MTVQLWPIRSYVDASELIIILYCVRAVHICHDKTPSRRSRGAIRRQNSLRHFRHARQPSASGITLKSFHLQEKFRFNCDDSQRYIRIDRRARIGIDSRSQRKIIGAAHRRFPVHRAQRHSVSVSRILLVTPHELFLSAELSRVEHVAYYREKVSWAFFQR